MIANWYCEDGQMTRTKVSMTGSSDSDEFLSEYGIRSLSKYHEQHPFVVRDR